MKVYTGENIAFIRNYKRATYDDMAAAVGCTPGMLKTYTLKDVTPPIELLCAIADYAGLTLDALVRVRLDAHNYNEMKTGITRKLKIDPLDLIRQGVEMLENKAVSRAKTTK